MIQTHLKSGGGLAKEVNQSRVSAGASAAAEGLLNDSAMLSSSSDTHVRCSGGQLEVVDNRERETETETSGTAQQTRKHTHAQTENLLLQSFNWGLKTQQ